MKTFRLPDLGEGLQDAEIVEWHVAAGDDVVADAPLVSMETDKAIVEVPSPWSGRVYKLHGIPGDVIVVNGALVEFEGADDAASVRSASTTGDSRQPDGGTVVGNVERGTAVINERASTVGAVPLGVKATPAVRALAKRLDVDLMVVTPSGRGGLVTAADVQRVAKVFAELGPIERLRGPRRAMARNMTMAHSEVVPATVCDDADVDEWPQGSNITVRLIRAVVAGCRASPALNAWYDAHSVGRRVLEKIHLGIAIDTEDGLFVPVLQDVGSRASDDLHAGLERIKSDVKSRTIPAEELRGNTFTLSNFGTLAGKYAGLVVLPPTVGILGAGVVRRMVVATDSGPAMHRVLPLSLTFDHRAVTGGEAARFLAASIEDLKLAQ